MASLNLLLTVCLGYVALLFAVAFLADRFSARRSGAWLRSPLVYTLSLSIYCTAWTFYGAVGYAARSGLEFVTIYLGPTLVMIGWWCGLRKLVRVGRSQRVTSIAHLVPSRYGNRFAYGHVVDGPREMVVSGGLGLSIMPVRFGVPPEIVVIDLGGRR